MIEFENNGRLLESELELQILRDAPGLRPGAVARLYLDYETGSGDPKKYSTNPWRDCYPIGFAVTWDNHPYSYWVDQRCVGEDGARLTAHWLMHEICGSGEVGQTPVWVNHNVKYDAHVQWNYWGVPTPARVCDTLDQAKIIDSDRLFKGGYGLDVLAKQWLHEDISKYEVDLRNYLGKSKDYGQIPSNVLGIYACQDVLTNRRIDRYIKAKMPEQCAYISGIEDKLTRIFIDVERRGLRIDPVELKIREYVGTIELMRLLAELKELVGYDFDPGKSDHLFDVLINMHGLPVVKYTERTEAGGGGNPSFDKHAMAEYLAHPFAPQEIVTRIAKYKKRKTQLDIFVKPYQEQHVGNFIHSNYNLTVVTGRMSCSEPNMQQLDSEAKELVHPREGYSFISVDASQIEFRTIVHYCKDVHAIEAYNENPDTDFHQWVAGLLGIDRSPAKTCNFLMGYGGGKAALVRQLSANMKLVGQLKKRVQELIESGEVDKLREQEVFKILCQRRAEKVYEQYHASLPTLKTSSWAAADALKSKGYVFNLLGRHRHLDYDGAHKAFNSLNQATAADIMKDRLVASVEWIARKQYPIHVVAAVHDEILYEAPTTWVEANRYEGGALSDLLSLLEHPKLLEGQTLRVPIRFVYGISAKHWKDAAKEPKDGGSGGLQYEYRRNYESALDGYA